MSILTSNRYEQVKPTVIQSNGASISTPIYIGLIIEQNNEETAANNARNAAMRQRSLEDARAPLKESEVQTATHPPSMPIEVIAEQPREIPTTRLKSHSSNELDRNRKYKIRRAALGDHPRKKKWMQLLPMV